MTADTSPEPPSDPLAKRRKVFRWIASIGLVVFAIYLLFIVATLHGCDHLGTTPH